jgi:iron complex transport system ATP-binding protein
VTVHLEVQGVNFAFGVREILKSISFQAREREFVGILGPNGVGKSTLLHLLGGHYSPGAGKVLVDGVDQAQWVPRELAKKISHLPQTIHADLPFTAVQLVAMGRYPHTDRWYESEEDRKSIQRAMQRTECIHLQGRQFFTLSGGERQRVLLAACLAQETGILLLDEPSTFLDIEQQLRCFELLREEASSGKLCIAVTHDLNLAASYCTRLIVLNEGQVRYDLQNTDIVETPEWLEIFSPRLCMGRTPSGKPWIWHQ